MVATDLTPDFWPQRLCATASLQSAHAGFFDAVNTQDVAEPIIATLVGSIGLIAAVPLTTGLAALLAAQVPATALPDAQHGHAH